MKTIALKKGIEGLLNRIPAGPKGRHQQVHGVAVIGLEVQINGEGIVPNATFWSSMEPAVAILTLKQVTQELENNFMKGKQDGVPEVSGQEDNKLELLTPFGMGEVSTPGEV